MALFVANFQISIAVGSFVGGVLVDTLGISSTMIFGAIAAAIALATIVLFGDAQRLIPAEALAT